MVTAHRLAIASPHITADMIEVAEFPQVALRYQVQGVPKTIINEEHSFIGSQPEAEAIQAVLKALGK